MLKQIAWNTFKNTGDINTMMELIKVEKIIKNNEQIIKNKAENAVNNISEKKI